MVGVSNTESRSNFGGVIVGTFATRAVAQRAVEELMRSGFREDQIGVVSRDGDGYTTDESGGTRHPGETGAETGVLTGAAAGAGGGVLWGLGIAAGVLPAIGPVIAGGILAAVAASAAAGAAAGGVLGALVGLGIPEDDARQYEQEFTSGRTIVTVRTESQGVQATEILRRHGGFESTNADRRYVESPVVTP